MGLGPKLSSSYYDNKVVSNFGNPDPRNYNIKSYFEIENYLILFINYPNYYNYEGDKILVFKGIKLEELKRKGIIDPHFSRQNPRYSPIARFRPTTEGYDDALSFCYSRIER